MLEDIFNQTISEWVEHCKNPKVKASSSVRPVMDCDPYRKIVSMGPKALPLIRKLYDKNNSGNSELSIIQAHGLIGAVSEIVGDGFQIPEAIHGRVKEMEEYTKNWLDAHMPEYM